MIKSQKTLPIKRALLWIFLSTLFVSGVSALGFFYYQQFKKTHQGPAYTIQAIIQTTPEKERLKTIYLAELLKLSVDHPTNLFRFDVKEAQRVLKLSPLIKEATIKKIHPGILFVDYTLRKPIAYLLDFTNTVIDHEGVAFPFKPFFTPKNLPEIYLGLDEESSLEWGAPIKGIKSKLAIYLLELMQTYCCTDSSTLVRMDVSKVLEESYGQKQIIVIMEDRQEVETESKKMITIITPHVLRLSVENYRQELAHYLTLRPLLRKKSKASDDSERLIHLPQIIIDLRIPELAYLYGINKF